MKTEISLHLRQFPVLAHDHRTGEEEAITVTVAKQQLQAAQIVGQSSFSVRFYYFITSYLMPYANRPYQPYRQHRKKCNAGGKKFEISRHFCAACLVYPVLPL